MPYHMGNGVQYDRWGEYEQPEPQRVNITAEHGVYCIRDADNGRLIDHAPHRDAAMAICARHGMMIEGNIPE